MRRSTPSTRRPTTPSSSPAAGRPVPPPDSARPRRSSSTSLPPKSRLPPSATARSSSPRPASSKGARSAPIRPAGTKSNSPAASSSPPAPLSTTPTPTATSSPPPPGRPSGLDAPVSCGAGDDDYPLSCHHLPPLHRRFDAVHEFLEDPHVEGGGGFGFGMELGAEGEPVFLGALDGFDDAVGAAGGDLKPSATSSIAMWCMLLTRISPSP